MFRKSIAVFLSFVMVLSFSMPAFAQGPIDPPGRQMAEMVSNKSLVALGDSITAGYGLERNLNRVSREAYPQLLGDEFGYRVTNLAVAGMTSGELLEMVKNNSRYRNVIEKADVIVVNTGGADLLHQLIMITETGTLNPVALQAAIAEVLSNIGNTLTVIRTELNTTAPILLYGLYNPLYEGHPAFEGTELTYTSLNLLISIATQGTYQNIDDLMETAINANIVAFTDIPLSGGIYVDAFAAYNDQNKATLLVDYVHPSRKGHMALFFAALKAMGLPVAA